MDNTFSTISFHTIDYIIMILFLVISMIIGVYFGIIKKQRTTEEYLLGNRQMQLVPIALSMLVSFQSAISVMGTPMEVVVYDSMIFQIYVGICLAILMQYIFIVPLLYPLRLTSVYEYLGRRFDSRAVQLLGTYIGMLQTILYMAVVLFAPALALEAACFKQPSVFSTENKQRGKGKAKRNAPLFTEVAGIPLWLSVIVIGVIGTIYTSLGGIKSVVWTDVYQFIMLYGGLAVILIMGGLKVGSLADIINISKEGRRLEFGRYDIDPRVRHSLWSCIIGGMFNWLPTCCNQATVQRMCAMKTEKEAKQAVLLNIPLMLLYGAILVLTGFVVYSYFVVYECDPIAAGLISNSNQLIPFFVIHVLNNVPGLAGIFAAALFSGALSSLSSGINSLAANTLQDVLVNYLEGALQVKKTLFAKIIVCVYGAITIGLAYGIRAMAGPVTQLAMTAFGACGGPVVGMIFLGAVFPQANWIGAFVGGVSGIVFNIWLAISCVIYGNKAHKLPSFTVAGCFANTTTAAANHTFSMTGLTTADPITATDLGALDMTTSTLHISSGSDHSPLYDMSYLYFGLTGILVAMLIGLVVSYLTGNDRGKPTDAIYILPGLRKVWKIGYKPVSKPGKKMSINNQDSINYDLEKRITPVGSPSLTWINRCEDNEL